MKNFVVGNNFYTQVVGIEKYNQAIKAGCPYDKRTTAIDIGEYILPLARSPLDAGIVYEDGVCAYNINTPQDLHLYASNGPGVIDFSSVDSLKEFYEKRTLIKDIRKDIAKDDSNVSVFPIGNNDAPELKAIKMAVNAKRIDTRDYEDRFKNYQNDIRLLTSKGDDDKGKTISLQKIITLCNAFDLSVTLTITDKESSSAPMNSTFTVELTEGR